MDTIEWRRKKINNIIEKIEYCKTERELLDLWREYDFSCNRKNFVYDGIIDETFYKCAKLKICFLLKECYFFEAYKKQGGQYPYYKYVSNLGDDCTFDLASALREMGPWHMWKRVGRIAKMVLDTAHIPCEKPFHSISVVNIKKSEGTKTSCHKEIKGIENETVTNFFLTKQLEMVNPDIIVCGGVFNVVKNSLLLQLGTPNEICNYSIESLKSAYLYGEKVVIDMWHPSARFSDKKVECKYKEKIGEILPFIKV